MREIRPAIVILVAADADHGPRLSARDDRDRRRDLSEAGARQPDREGRQGDRLGPDRAGVQGRQILPWPALGDLGAGPGRFDQDRVGALQRRQFRRLQPRPDQQGAERPGQGGCREAEGRKPLRRGARSISSPPRPAASIPISRRRARCSRCRAWPRRATCRRIAVRQLVAENTKGRFAGLLGEPRVNVLALNLALDAASK